MGVFMKRKKADLNTTTIPNFVLCDMEVQSAFAQMCQDFQKQATCEPSASDNWVIIDNDTGQIISSCENNKP